VVERASAQQPGGGVIEGFVTTQTGTIRLGGAQVVLHNSANQEVSTVLSEGDGRFRFTALQEGKYTLTASLEGFATARAAVVVAADIPTERSLDLPLATLTQTVEVSSLPHPHTHAPNGTDDVMLWTPLLQPFWPVK